MHKAFLKKCTSNYVPWLTAMASLFEMISIVSCVIFLMSQPRRRGACNSIHVFQTRYATSCISTTMKRVNINCNTLEIAHKLKCTIYSSFVIPPFPISSKSGSIDITIIVITKHFIWFKKNLQNEKKTLTIPTTRPCILSIQFVLISSRNHAARQQNIES